MKTGQGATQALARRIAEIRYDTLPDDVRTVAVQCVLDWTAVTLNPDSADCRCSSSTASSMKSTPVTRYPRRAMYME